MKIEVFQWIFEKYPDKKFHENPSGGSRVLLRERTEGRTDRYGGVTSCFVNCANATKSKKLKMYERRKTKKKNPPGNIKTSQPFPIM